MEIYFISNRETVMENHIVEIQNSYGLELNIFSTVNDFITQKAAKYHENKYVDFASWLEMFHIILFCWRSKNEKKEMYSQLSFEGPRIVRGIKFINRESSTQWITNVLSERLGKKLTKQGIIQKYKENLINIYRAYYPTKIFGYSENQASPLTTINKQVKIIFDPKNPIFFDEPYRKEGKQLSEIFNYCPWCCKEDIAISWIESPICTWERRCGRAGFLLTCNHCDQGIYFKLYAMS